MGKQLMLVNVHEDETRIALTENNLLVGLHVEQTDRERKVGNIYRGTVVKVNPAFQAAFVDYGQSRNGFLSISDVNTSLLPGGNGGKGRPRIQQVLKEGQTVMVQVLKEGLLNKGSALSTFISMPGRYMVVTPNSDRSGVSRKVDDPEARQRLKDVLAALQGEDDLGIILRTAGVDRSVSELKRDLDALRKEWKGIQERFKRMKKPGLVHAEPSTIVRVLRDYFTEDIQEVWVDDPEGFQEALGFFKSTLPKFQKRLKLYVGDKSLFSAYRVEEQIQALDSSRVPLPSGGSLVIESTEALVSVDVNSGRSQGADIEETALQTNLEAAREISRQLRLRNLGGLIVLDFIDMTPAKNRKKVEQTLAEALKDDKARTTIGQISQFGLLELSRQRIDMEISHGLRVQCPSCGGTGYVPTVNASANNVLRKIRELAATGKYAEIHGDLPLDAANYLLNEKREALRDLELEFEIGLRLRVDPDLPPGHNIRLHGSAEEGEEDDGRAGRAAEADQGAEAAADGESRRRKRRRRPRRRDEGEQELAIAAQQAVEEIEAPYGVDEVDELEPASEVQAEPEEADEGYTPVEREPEPRHERPERDRDRRGRSRREERRPRAERGEASDVRGQRIAAAPGSGGAERNVVFQSQHVDIDPAVLAKLPPRRTPSRPFAAIIDSIAPNTVIFDSAVNLRAAGGAGKAADNGAATETAEEAPARSGRKRRGRGRRGGSQAESGSEASEAAERAEAVAEAAEAVVAEEAPAAAGEAPARGGRKRRSRPRKAPAEAPAAEAAAPEAAQADEQAAGSEAKSTSRRRPRGRSKAKAEAAGEAEAASAGNGAEASASPGNGNAGEEATGGESKRPSRRRRPRGGRGRSGRSSDGEASANS